MRSVGIAGTLMLLLALPGCLATMLGTVAEAPVAVGSWAIEGAADLTAVAVESAVDLAGGAIRAVGREAGGSAREVAREATEAGAGLAGDEQVAALLLRAAAAGVR